MLKRNENICIFNDINLLRRIVHSEIINKNFKKEQDCTIDILQYKLDLESNFKKEREYIYIY